MRRVWALEPMHAFLLYVRPRRPLLRKRPIGRLTQELIHTCSVYELLREASYMRRVWAFYVRPHTRRT